MDAYFHHAKSYEAKLIAPMVAKNPELAKFKEFRELGEGKDMNSEVDRKNIERKKQEGVIKYSTYTVDAFSKKWILGCKYVELNSKKGVEFYEKPYYCTELK